MLLLIFESCLRLILLQLRCDVKESRDIALRKIICFNARRTILVHEFRAAQRPSNTALVELDALNEFRGCHAIDQSLLDEPHQSIEGTQGGSGIHCTRGGIPYSPLDLQVVPGVSPRLDVFADSLKLSD